MAKGLRSSVKKNNRTKLRARVFGPVVDARTERLSAKLLELAQQPKAARTEMEVDSEKGTSTSLAPTKPLTSTNTAQETTDAQQQPAGTEGSAPLTEEMDVDGVVAKPTAAKSSSSSAAKKRDGKITKRRHRKAKNEISFPKYDRNAKKGKLGRKGK